jgi:hypothetical protein
MTKSELIENLKKRVSLVEKSRHRFKCVYLPILIILYTVAYIYLPFPELRYFSVETILAGIFLVCLWAVDVWSNLASKIYCEHCTAEFSEDSLAYSVAVNACNNCMKPMYET